MTGTTKREATNQTEWLRERGRIQRIGKKRGFRVAVFCVQLVIMLTKNL